MVERSTCGSGGCVTCPFSCSEEAEQVQNYGCLPDSFHILEMNREHGVNWSCHQDEKVICGGFARAITDPNSRYSLAKGLVLDKSAPLVYYDEWYKEGAEEAIRLAKERACER